MGKSERSFKPHRDARKRWARVRLAILTRDKRRCQTCGRAARLEVDHCKPIVDGGHPWELSNLQALCRSCHISKTRAEHHARRAAGQTPPERAWSALVKELSSA